MKFFPLVFLIFFACLIVSLNGCKKDSKKKPVTNTEVVQPDSDVFLTDEEEEFLASIPSSNVTEKDIILPDGENLNDYLQANIPDLLESRAHVGKQKTLDISKAQSAQYTKMRIIAEMVHEAYKLTQRSNYKAEYEGSNKPAQPNGLAYVWGGKNPAVRKTSSSSGGVCSEELYGVDCGGYVYQMAKSAGLSFFAIEGDIGTTFLKQKNNWNAVFAAQSYQKLQMDDLGYQPFDLADLETGDVIYWSDHIGLVVQSPLGPLVYNARGGPDNSCGKNSDGQRGPSLVPLSTMIGWLDKKTNQYPFKNWGVLRMTIQISGNWALSIRCQNTTRDLFVLPLTFPVTQTNQFTLNQTATDYDNSTNHFTLNFTYAKLTNILSCTETSDDSFIPGFYRTDTFSVQLYTDDTGYVPAQNTAMVKGTGCTEEIRLQNVEALQ